MRLGNEDAETGLWGMAYADDTLWMTTGAEQKLKRKMGICEKSPIPLYYPGKRQASLGGVIMQDHGRGLQPIAFESRSLNAHECNYNTTERELLAIVHCIRTWRHYLQFSKYKMMGDHRPLMWLFSPSRELSSRQARCIDFLNEVGMPNMDFVPGALIPVPDALSRRSELDHKFTPRQGLELGEVTPTEDMIRVRDVGDLLTDNPMETAHAIEPLRVRKQLCVQNGMAAVTRPGQCCTTARDLAEMTIAKPWQEMQHRDWSAGSVFSVQAPAAHDAQNWRVSPTEYDRWARACGPFDVDACCDDDGQNRQPGIPQYWSPGKSCLLQDWAGLRIWCNPPFTDEELQLDRLLLHLHHARERNPTTAAVLILPRWTSQPWYKLLHLFGLKMLHRYPPGYPMFISPDFAVPIETLWEVEVWHAPPNAPLRRPDFRSGGRASQTNNLQRFSQIRERPQSKTRSRTLARSLRYKEPRLSSAALDALVSRTK